MRAYSILRAVLSSIAAAAIFVELLRSMTEPAARTHLDAIVVDYDTELGYPASIEYRAKRTVADGGSTYALRNVQLLVADRR